MKIIRVIDLETGFPRSDKGTGIIQYGHYDLIARGQDILGNPTDWEVADEGIEILINPGHPIYPNYSAINDIIDEDVAGKMTWEQMCGVVTDLSQYEAGAEILAYAAHSAESERGLIDSNITLGKPWICIYRASLRLWPESRSHSNNAVRHHIRPAGMDRMKAQPLHRAMSDAYITAFTLREALNQNIAYETLAKWTNEPAYKPRCTIGDQHRTPDGAGTPWNQVETGFLEWILTKNFDEDTKHTVNVELDRRRVDARIAAENAELERQFVNNGMSAAADTQRSML